MSTAEVGVLGAGNIGRAFARHLVKAGYRVKATVGDLLENVGFSPVDLGTLSVGGRLQQAGAPLAGLNLVRMS